MAKRNPKKANKISTMQQNEQLPNIEKNRTKQ